MSRTSLRRFRLVAAVLATAGLPQGAIRGRVTDRVGGELPGVETDGMTPADLLSKVRALALAAVR